MRLAVFATLTVIGGMTLAGAVAPVHAQTYRQLYSFSGSKVGRTPHAGLIAFHGRLFGTTYRGGSRNCAGGCGTVFSLQPVTGKEKTIYSFQGGSDGANPECNLINVGGLFYGTTTRGGVTGAGTAFSIDPSKHVEKILYTFQAGKDGEQPVSGLLDVAGTLYGVTKEGGARNAGTVYAIDVATGAEKVVYSFEGEPDGRQPYSNLIDDDGVLYGTTVLGGRTDLGTVFSVDLNTGAETVLHSFGMDADGSSPRSSLTKVGDKLYGTTASGGDDGVGTVFWINPINGLEKVVYSFGFNHDDGITPYSGLTDVDGTLYGTTYSGGDCQFCGSFGAGTVFAVNLATNTEKVVYNFQGGNDGSNPLFSTLTKVEGTLYGTTRFGGTGAHGTVFAVTP